MKLKPMILVSLLWCLQLPLAAALPWDAYIHFWSGYRKDKLNTTILAFDNPEVFGTDTTLLFEDHLKIQNIDVFETGLKGEINICRWFVRAWGAMGNPQDGRYIEKIHLPGTAKVTDTIFKADVFRGRTRDLFIAAGYVFPIWCCWEDGIFISIAPMIGYAWNNQRVQINRAARTLGQTPETSFPILNGLTYKNHWKGPWIGLELEFENPWIELKGGYEYHWPQWRAKWLLSGPDVPGIAFSDRRRGHVYFGSNAYVDARYYLLKGWYIETEVNFRYWRSKGGKEVPLAGSFSDVGIPDTQQNHISKAVWQSFGIQLAMGYYF